MVEQPSNWKRWLSYLWPIRFETRHSKYSGDLHVFLYKGYWRLETDHAIYSSGKYYPPFGESIKFAGFPPEGAKILLLGLGTGSAVEILDEAGKIYHITAVDVDPAIIELSKKYLMTPKEWTIKYYCHDAAEWVKNERDTYDLVFADVFVHESTPEQVTGELFLEKLKQLIAPGGRLLFSKLHNSIASIRENEVFARSFEVVFPNYEMVDTDGNRVFCWKNDG